MPEWRIARGATELAVGLPYSEWIGRGHTDEWGAGRGFSCWASPATKAAGRLMLSKNEFVTCSALQPIEECPSIAWIISRMCNCRGT